MHLKDSCENVGGPEIVVRELIRGKIRESSH
jgi:hypothetical protein